eukprot:233374-Rhodomonas_salina.1
MVETPPSSWAACLCGIPAFPLPRPGLSILSPPRRLPNSEVHAEHTPPAKTDERQGEEERGRGGEERGGRSEAKGPLRAGSSRSMTRREGKAREEAMTDRLEARPKSVARAGSFSGSGAA